MVSAYAHTKAARRATRPAPNEGARRDEPLAGADAAELADAPAEPVFEVADAPLAMMRLVDEPTTLAAPALALIDADVVAAADALAVPFPSFDAGRSDADAETVALPPDAAPEVAPSASAANPTAGGSYRNTV